MMPKELKIALKEIREAVKNNEHDQAIQKCNNVLCADPNNYMALVLMGASYQQKDKKQSAKYLRKAIKSCGDTVPTLALQGLINCAEINELPDILNKLLKLIPEKYDEYHPKIFTVAADERNLNDCVEIFISEINIENDNNEARIKSAWICLGKIFIKMTEILEKWQYLLKPALKCVIADTGSSPHLEYYKRLLRQLYKLNELDELIREACKMTELYPKELYPLEWICKIYCDSYNVMNFNELLTQPITDYVNKLLELYPNSQSGNHVKAILLVDNMNYVQARDILLNVNSKTIAISNLLAKCCMEMGAYNMAEDIYRTINAKNHEFVECLSYTTHKETLTEALELMGKFDENDLQVLQNLTRIYYNLNDKDNLLKIIEKIKDLNNSELAVLLEIEYFKTPEEAICMLEKLPDNDFHTELLKGKLMLIAKAYEKSLTCLLKATKLKPYKYECFLYLGVIYLVTNDIVRSAKCFDKCLHLNPYCKEALSNLCAINRKREDFDLTVSVIDRILKQIPPHKSEWALFQQGLHYMHIEQFDDAINSFRTVLRHDIKNISYWEALADSYQERGSYDSAMRVYEKVLEIDPSNSYSLLQIATLQSLLRMFKEAIENFDKVLEQDPNYFPALKGAADAQYGLALILMSDKLLGRAKDHLQFAINYLQKIFLLGKRDMVWIWRLTAKIFVAVGRLPQSLASLEVCGKLAGKNDALIKLNRKELFQLAIKYFTCAIKLNEKDTLVWNDLGLCAYYYALLPNQTASEQEENIELAKKACRFSIKCQPNRWKSWNFLGVLYTVKTDTIKPNFSLAQHYFIKSLMLDKKSAITWANLGVIYLQSDNILLANKAFNRALQTDPEYINGWIGSALIAEKVGEDVEAMDMFRNCTELEFHHEAALGYANWVCNVVSDSKCMAKDLYKYAIENMHAVAIAHDSMTWYLSAEEAMTSVSALSYYGYLSARQHQWRLAVGAFSAAVDKATGNDKDMMLFNLGFCFVKIGKPIKAIEAFTGISEATLKSTVGLALAYSQDKRYQESYAQYTSALEWMTASDMEKGEILLAMAAMIYPFQGEDDTKAVLYQCMSLENRPIQALYSACALGIKHDIQLAETVVEELKKYENDPKYCHNVAFLTAQLYLVKNAPKRALIYLVSIVHRYPDNPLLRKVLANFIVNNYSKTKKYSNGACQISQSVITLGHHNSTNIDSLESANSLLTASEAIKNVNIIKQQKLIQQAIHLHPANTLAWKALTACKV